MSPGIGVAGILSWGMYVHLDEEETNENCLKRKEKISVKHVKGGNSTLREKGASLERGLQFLTVIERGCVTCGTEGTCEAHLEMRGGSWVSRAPGGNAAMAGRFPSKRQAGECSFCYF